VAYQTISNNFTTLNGVTYITQWDKTNGNGRIIAANAPPGTAPVYTNGSWNQAAATSAGFNTTLQNQLHQSFVKSIQQSYVSVGGVNSGAKIGQWASQNFTNGQPGQNTANPQQSVPGANQAQSPNGGVAGAALDVVLDGGKSAIAIGQNDAYFGQPKNEARLFRNFTMKYPDDLDMKGQDIFEITQYEYKATKGAEIFGTGGSKAAFDILSRGLQLGSPIGLESPVGTVFLPMPNSISDNNSVGWGEDTMGNLSAAITAQTFADPGGTVKAGALGGVLGSIVGAGGAGASFGMLLKNLDSIIRAGGQVPEEMKSLLGPELVSRLVKAQGLGVSAESILARGAGIVPNSNMELLFQSPALRSFSFTYRLSPRSAKEARIVRRIIRFFKQGMAAKKKLGKAGAASFFLGTPNVFKLSYKNRGNPITGVNRFKICALTNFSCNFTPDGVWAAYEAGQPVSTIVSMQFNELEPIYDTDYQMSIQDGRTDLQGVDDEAVGY